MAGLGRRTFAPGEVLTASNVMGYLQDQAVMKFAGTAARGSAIGTAVAEGMVTWLDDSNTIEAYDGSAWKQYASASSPRGVIPATSGGTNSLTYAYLSSNITISTGTTDLFSMSFTGVAGRLYKATFMGYIDTAASSGRFEVLFTDGSNTVVKRSPDQTNTLWARTEKTASYLFTATGSTTLKLRIGYVDSAIYVYGSAYPDSQSRFVIEDIGAAS